MNGAPLRLYNRGVPLPDLDRVSTLVDLLAGADAGSVVSLISDDVVFSSPVAEYRGRADVVHLLGCIARVLRDLAPTGESSDGVSRLTTLTARVGEHPVEGVLREYHDDAGQLTHATLFLRPYTALRAAIKEMSKLLAGAPLPSSSR